jgi:hypothetical protein
MPLKATLKLVRQSPDDLQLNTCDSVTTDGPLPQGMLTNKKEEALKEKVGWQAEKGNRYTRKEREKGKTRNEN